MSNVCWECGKPVDNTIQFKTICESCFTYLHCCKGCRFYQQGKPNDCLIPGTEQIADREANNYCDDFKPITSFQKRCKPNIDEISKRLFKDE